MRRPPTPLEREMEGIGRSLARAAAPVVVITGDHPVMACSIGRTLGLLDDAPALRRAEIGVVMGLSGTDAAREAGVLGRRLTLLVLVGGIALTATDWARVIPAWVGVLVVIEAAKRLLQRRNVE